MILISGMILLLLGGESKVNEMQAEGLLLFLFSLSRAGVSFLPFLDSERVNGLDFLRDAIVQN